MDGSAVIAFFTQPGESQKIWVAQIFLIVLATLAINLLVVAVVRHMDKTARDTQNLWDDALIHAVGKPAGWLIWVLGLSLAVELAYDVSGAPVFTVLPEIRAIALILLVSWFLVRFLRHAEHNLSDPQYNRKPMDPTTAQALGKLLRASVVITAVLIIMQHLGYSVSGVLAFGGIGGLAVGFAAKDLLANFFGGLMIYLDRPFAVGDWVRSPDKDIEGTVEDIGWRLTRIRTFDKRPLYVPNSFFNQIAVENPSRMTHRRIYETVGIRYSDAGKMDAIVADVKSLLQEHPEIDTDQTLIVNFIAFAASSLNFFVYAYTRTTNWVHYHSVKQDVMLKVIDIIEGHGAECAFPTSTVHLFQETARDDHPPAA